MYCSLLKLTHTKTQISRIESLERRANQIVFGGAEDNVEFNLIKSSQRNVCSLVHDVIKKNTCEPFFDYFNLRKSDKNTRNNGYFLSMPKMKLDMVGNL